MNGIAAQVKDGRVDDPQWKVVEAEDEPTGDKGEEAGDAQCLRQSDDPLVGELQLDNALAALHDDITDIVQVEDENADAVSTS